jgi:hypothetical protein
MHALTIYARITLVAEQYTIVEWYDLTVRPGKNAGIWHRDCWEIYQLSDYLPCFIHGLLLDSIRRERPLFLPHADIHHASRFDDALQESESNSVRSGSLWSIFTTIW